MHMLVLSISNTRTKFEKFSFAHSKDMMRDPEFRQEAQLLHLGVILLLEPGRSGCVKGSALSWRPLQMLREEQGHKEMGFPAPSSACELYLGSALQEWEPNSTQGVCGSRSSPPTLLSAISRSFHRTL